MKKSEKLFYRIIGKIKEVFVSRKIERIGTFQPYFEKAGLEYAFAFEF